MQCSFLQFFSRPTGSPRAHNCHPMILTFSRNGPLCYPTSTGDYDLCMHVVVNSNMQQLVGVFMPTPYLVGFSWWEWWVVHLQNLHEQCSGKLFITLHFDILKGFGKILFPLLFQSLEISIGNKVDKYIFVVKYMFIYTKEDLK